MTGMYDADKSGDTDIMSIRGVGGVGGATDGSEGGGGCTNRLISTRL
jgi:hypothetical protein